jgi:peptidoglycan/LPS O-acetylase OafA/YrhL
MKINAIEGLRAYLAWYVVIGHTLHFSGYMAPHNSLQFLATQGAFAVDIFIIISGFVIFYLLDRRKEAYKPYMIRRFFRIYPLFLVALVAGLLLSNIRLENLEIGSQLAPETTNYLKHRWETHSANKVIYLLPALFMFHGLIPQAVLPYASTAFNGPIWSISLEMQFYALAPFIIIGLVSRKIRPIFCTLLAIAAVFEGSFIRTELGSFLIEHLNWFMLGWLSYFIFKYAEVYKAIISKIPISLGAASILVIFLYFNQDIKSLILWKVGFRQIPYLPLLIWIVFFAFIIDSLKSEPPIPYKLFKIVFENTLILELGKLSYSTYLLHIPILTIVLNFILRLNIPETKNDLFISLLAISMPLIYIVSKLAYEIIELPGIKMGSRYATRCQSASGKQACSDR